MNNDQDKYISLYKKLAEMLNDSSKNHKNCPDQETIAAYSDGVLAENEIEDLEEHMAACRECSDLLVSLHEIKETFQNENKKLPPNDIIRNIKNLVPENSTSLLEKISGWFEFMIPAPAYTVVAMLVMVIIVGTIYIRYDFLKKSDYSPIEQFSVVSAKNQNQISKSNETTTFKGENLENYFKAFETKESETLKAGGNFSANLKLNEKAYIYILRSNSNGEIEKLFPKEGMENMVNENIDYNLPVSLLEAKDVANKLHLIVSKNKISDLNTKLNTLKASGIENIDKIFSGTSTKTIDFEQAENLK